MSIERKQFEAKLEQLRPILDESHPGTGAGIIVMLKVAWNVAYEAGEIAMKEKAANRAAEFYLAKGDALDIARAIRALAISGAEESTSAEK